MTPLPLSGSVSVLRQSPTVEKKSFRAEAPTRSNHRAEQHLAMSRVWGGGGGIRKKEREKEEREWNGGETDGVEADDILQAAIKQFGISFTLNTENVNKLMLITEEKRLQRRLEHFFFCV